MKVAKPTINELAYQSAKQLSDNLITDGQSIYDNLTIVPFDMAKGELTRTSLFAQKHPEILDNAIKTHGLDIHQFIDYVPDRFITAEILLAEIYKLLKKGKIDSQSFGELINNKELMSINHELTDVKEVLDISTEQGVKFVFDVVRELPITKRIIGSDVLLVLIVAVTKILIVFLSYALYKQNKTAGVVESAPMEIMHAQCQRETKLQDAAYKAVDELAIMVDQLDKDDSKSTVEDPINGIAGASETFVVANSASIMQSSSKGGVKLAESLQRKLPLPAVKRYSLRDHL